MKQISTQSQQPLSTVFSRKRRSEEFFDWRRIQWIDERTICEEAGMWRDDLLDRLLRRMEETRQTPMRLLVLGEILYRTQSLIDDCERIVVRKGIEGIIRETLSSLWGDQ